MGKYNRNFDLGLADLELIERALQQNKKDLSVRRLNILAQGAANEGAKAELDEIQSSLTQTQDLLGRLHNQKVFYRPSNASTPYIGG